MSSTLHNFFISVVNFNTAFFSCQKKIPFFSVFLHKNMGLQAAVSKTAVFSVLSITGKISRNTVFPVEARQDPSMRLRLSRDDRLWHLKSPGLPKAVSQSPRIQLALNSGHKLPVSKAEKHSKARTPANNRKKRTSRGGCQKHRRAGCA